MNGLLKTVELVFVVIPGSGGRVTALELVGYIFRDNRWHLICVVSRIVSVFL